MTPHGIVSRAWAIVALTATAALIATATFGQPTFQATELPPIQTSGGTFDGNFAWAMNERGQVAGEADKDYDFRAVRYTPEVGMEDLQPDRAPYSYATLINERGDVFGYLFEGIRTYRANFQVGFFIYRGRPGQGPGEFDFLEKGSRQALRVGFQATDMNEAGDVIGRFDGHLPFLYDHELGWTPLLPLDRRLRRGFTEAVKINDAGEILLRNDRPNGMVDEFLLRRNGRISRLGNLGGGAVYSNLLAESGRTIGSSETAAGQLHAFIFDPGAGMTDIHRRFDNSAAVWLTSRGVIGGVMLSEAEPNGLRHGLAIFTWDETRRPQLQVVARRMDFQPLLAADHATVTSITALRMNERLEFVGQVQGSTDGGASIERFFFRDAQGHVYDMEKLLRAAGLDREILQVRGFNDRCDILLTTESGDRYGTVILSPAE